jgi:hypothetical protein
MLTAYQPALEFTLCITAIFLLDGQPGETLRYLKCITYMLMAENAIQIHIKVFYFKRKENILFVSSFNYY